MSGKAVRVDGAREGKAVRSPAARVWVGKQAECSRITRLALAVVP
ncbi:hypothetical protein [Brevibacillus composti]|nr:hypothetical protein [Brevibacillus composti]